MKLSKEEKQILENLSQSVEFVKKFNKGKAKAKSISQTIE